MFELMVDTKFGKVCIWFLGNYIRFHTKPEHERGTPLSVNGIDIYCSIDFQMDDDGKFNFRKDYEYITRWRSFARNNLPPAATQKKLIAEAQDVVHRVALANPDLVTKSRIAGYKKEIEDVIKDIKEKQFEIEKMQNKVKELEKTVIEIQCRLVMVPTSE